MFEPKSGLVTLIDFGLCVNIRNGDCFTTEAGSKEYLAPELF